MGTNEADSKPPSLRRRRRRADRPRCRRRRRCAGWPRTAGLLPAMEHLIHVWPATTSAVRREWARIRRNHL